MTQGPNLAGKGIGSDLAWGAMGIQSALRHHHMALKNSASFGASEIIDLEVLGMCELLKRFQLIT